MIETVEIFHDWTGTVDAPLRLVEGVVPGDWVDEYGHMNMAMYLAACDRANWAFFNWINDPVRMDARAGHEYVIVENHVTYGAELAEGAGFAIETRLLAWDAKRYILFHRVLTDAGAVAATNEAKMLGFDLNTRRPEAWQPEVAARLAAISAAHDGLERPVEAGQGIMLGRR